MDYAAIFCSLAEYYGLECRIMRSGNRYCEEVDCDEDELPGWEEADFQAFKPLLDKNNLPITLEALNSVAEDTWAHYWVEVFLDGKWIYADASAQDTYKRYNKNDVVIVDWQVMDKSDEIFSYLGY